MKTFKIYKFIITIIVVMFISCNFEIYYHIEYDPEYNQYYPKMNGSYLKVDNHGNIYCTRRWDKKFAIYYNNMDSALNFLNKVKNEK